jgi:hypothetical protein
MALFGQYAFRPFSLPHPNANEPTAPARTIATRPRSIVMTCRVIDDRLDANSAPGSGRLRMYVVGGVAAQFPGGCTRLFIAVRARRQVRAFGCVGVRTLVRMAGDCSYRDLASSTNSRYNIGSQLHGRRAGGQIDAVETTPESLRRFSRCV